MGSDLRTRSPTAFSQRSHTELCHVRRRRRTKDDSTGTGVIEEVLPNALFRVTLEDGRTVRAGIAPSLRHALVRLISGSKVTVKLSTLDPGRGQIIKKLS
ncbi:MAG TPA: hypothetical protein VNW92_10295 [Polyangiaceae bacterium]|nr:hypothetical protein [Polyangiaceae bacterium]